MESSKQWPQYLTVFSATFLTIGNGIQLAWPSPSVPKLLSKELGFDVSEDEVSYIVMFSPLGYVIGSPLCGFLLDRIGRKYTLLLLAPMQVITWCTIAVSENVTTLYLSRILMGISDGGMFTALPAYLGEIIEPKIRGRVGTSATLGILAGVVFINVYGSYLPVRTAAYISLVFPIIFLVTFAWMPDSPYYFIAKGADHRARAALKALRRMENVDIELSQIKKSVQRQLSEPGRLQDIFTVKSNVKAFFVLAMLRTVQQFSGMHSVGFYMQVIFKNAESLISPHVSTIICQVITLLFTFASSFFIDRFGRKIMILWSCVGTSLTLLTMGTYFYLQNLEYNLELFKWVPLITLVLYFMCCSLGLLIVPTLMMGELLPSNIKAKALALMNIYYGLCMGASSKLLHWTQNRFGYHVPFYIFTAVCTFGIFFTHYFVPETKGKTLEEIQQSLKASKTVKESNVLLKELN